jgi:urease accessory protein
MSRGHQDGLLELTFRRDGRGRSALRARRQRFPLRTTVPLYLDPAARDMAFVYVQNPTGGVFAGDRLHTSVVADEGVRAHLTTQSATKLYRCEAGDGVQSLEFHVGPGAYVEHVPDPLIPHAGARFSQRLVADVAPGGAFVAAETLAPGRRAHGESMAYEQLTLHTEVRCDGRELCVDRLVFAPGRRNPRVPGVLGEAEYLVTLLAVAPESQAKPLAAALDQAFAAEAAISGAAGELPNGAGAFARVLAPDSLGARRALRLAWRTARNALVALPLPPLRK